MPETDITDYNAFFEELRGAESLPTTSQPSVGDFTSVYEPLLADGGEVVSVHISGGLSGTPESARRAAETLEREGKGGERVHVFDSTTAAGGLGLMVLAAAHAAAAGVPGAEIVERLAARGKSCACGSPSTRSSSSGAAAGSAPRAPGSGRRSRSSRFSPSRTR